MQMLNKTIIYYSSNRENPRFERQVVETMLHNRCGLPMISVTQKPMDIGHNICVGDVGQSYLNEFRQIYLGALEATSQYLVFAESDYLYPPDYFAFEPSEPGKAYRMKNIQVVFDAKEYPYYYPKSDSDGAQIIDRELFIKQCEIFFEGMPQWFAGDKNHNMPFRRRFTTHDKNTVRVSLENPCITFKTGKGVSWSVRADMKSQLTDVPYWGEITNLKKNYLYVS